MKLAGAFICVIGYGLALPVIFRIRKVYNERRGRWFAALMVAMVLVVVGYVLLGRPAPAVINAVSGLGLAWLWRELGRRAAAVDAEVDVAEDP